MTIIIDNPTANPSDAATALAPMLRSLGDQIERERRLPSNAVEALRAAGLFHLTVPSAINGLQADPIDQARAIEELAAADGSAGWCVMLASQTAALSGFVDPVASRVIFGQGGITTGSARPIGRAVPRPGGFLVSGRWPFGSGSSHADWFSGECLHYEEGSDQPLLDDNGDPITYMVYIPRDQVTVHDTWHTTGLRGTASNDYSVERVFVPEAYALRLFPAPWHPWTFYRSLALMFAGHGSHALGIGRAAVETAITTAQQKIGYGSSRPLAQVTRIQLQVAEALVLVESAREHLHGSITRLWDAAQRRDDLGKLGARMRLATSHALASSVRAVDLMHDALATSAIFTSNPLERQFRDIHTAAAHIMISPMTYEAAGRVELGLPAGMPYFE